jgi:DNA helicase-2/ATP-dependent DNA helicase PcrA
LRLSFRLTGADRQRIKKTLYTTHPNSTTVSLKVFSTPVIEASFIATEIKRLIAYSGGVLNYGDFAILRELKCCLHEDIGAETAVRYNALSRVVESALQKDSIPNRIIGGHKFFERMEIKDLLAYLQLADNPTFTVSLCCCWAIVDD